MRQKQDLNWTPSQKVEVDDSKQNNRLATSWKTFHIPNKTSIYLLIMESSLYFFRPLWRIETDNNVYYLQYSPLTTASVEWMTRNLASVFYNHVSAPFIFLFFKWQRVRCWERKKAQSAHALYRMPRRKQAGGFFYLTRLLTIIVSLNQSFIGAIARLVAVLHMTSAWTWPDRRFGGEQVR